MSSYIRNDVTIISFDSDNNSDNNSDLLFLLCGHSIKRCFPLAIVFVVGEKARYNPNLHTHVHIRASRKPQRCGQYTFDLCSEIRLCIHPYPSRSNSSNADLVGKKNPVYRSSIALGYDENVSAPLTEEMAFIKPEIKPRRFLLPAGEIFYIFSHDVIL